MAARNCMAVRIAGGFRRSCVSWNSSPSISATFHTRAAYGRAVADFQRWCEGQGISELGRALPVFPPVLPSQGATLGHPNGCFNRRESVRRRHHCRDDVRSCPRPGRRCWLSRISFRRKGDHGSRFREKGGNLNEMPRRRKLEEYLRAHVRATGIVDDCKRPLFRSAFGKTGRVSAKAMPRGDVWYRLSHLPRHGDYGLTHELRADRNRAAHGKALERETTGLYGRRNDTSASGRSGGSGFGTHHVQMTSCCGRSVQAMVSFVGFC